MASKHAHTRLWRLKCEPSLAVDHSSRKLVGDDVTAPAARDSAQLKWLNYFWKTEKLRKPHTVVIFFPNEPVTFVRIHMMDLNSKFFIQKLITGLWAWLGESSNIQMEKLRKRFKQCEQKRWSKQRVLLTVKLLAHCSWKEENYVTTNRDSAIFLSFQLP